MTTSHVDHKGVQTDPNIRHKHSKLLNKLQTYLTAVSRYRLNLFNQYMQSNQSSDNEDLFNVRKEILHRLQSVINELEHAIEYLQTHQLSDSDIQHVLNRPFIKEVIETALHAESSGSNNRKESRPNIEDWRMYRRDLQETKQDLHILDFLVHRGILKIDRLVNVTDLYT